MKKKQRLNIELFKKVRDRIASIPESYDQDTWLRESDSAPCGTAACLAGETIICAAPDVEAGIRRLRKLINSGSWSVPNHAAKLLGLRGDFTLGEEETIIFVEGAGGWPNPFRKRFQRARTNRGRANAAVAYLDHIIETGKVLE